MAELGANMSTNAANDLLNLIREHPDAAELYFQKVAPGLERVPGTSDGGVQRRQVSGVVILPYADIQAALDMNPLQAPGGHGERHQLLEQAVRSAMEHPYPFSRSYGEAPTKW
jgi:hypothetical protein